MLNPRLSVLIALIVVVSIFRLIPHPPNFTPVLALALFAGAHFSNRKLAFAVPIIALLLTDLLLGLHATLPFVYAAVMLIVLAGIWLHKHLTVTYTVCLTLASSIVFFVLTNFGAWLSLPQFYPRSWEGLVMAYIAAIPFFQNALAANLLFTSILFGGFYLLQRRFTSLALPANQ